MGERSKMDGRAGRTLGFGALMVAVAVAVAGCMDTSFESTRTGDASPLVELRIEIPQEEAGASVTAESTPPPSLLVRQSDGEHELAIGTTLMVMKTPVLARQDVEACPEPDPQAETQECPPFFIGNGLVELPLSANVTALQSIFVEPGTYDRLSFVLNVPEAGDEDDAAFLARNPSLEGVSVRLTGTFDGEAFSRVEIGVEEELDLFLPSSLDLQQEDTAVLFLRVDIRGWFLDAEGMLIDPRTAEDGGENHEIVSENIRESFSVVTG